MDTLFATLSSLLVVIVVTRLTGTVARLLNQPRVVGEIIGGIMLGPSLLGAIAPNFANAVLPTAAMPYLSILSQVGVLLFMFMIGLEVDLQSLKRAGKAALLISQTSIVFPFALGIGFAYFAYAAMAPRGIGYLGFALFIGTSMSVTAFPVLARILTESPLHRTPIGDLALTCAAIDDATAWCLLAVITGVLKSAVSGAFYTVILTVAYIVFMFYIVKPLLEKLVPWLEKSSDHLSETALAFVIVGLLASAVTTEMIGIHALFGGFILGVVIPHESVIAKDITLRLGDLVRVLFLPAFFAFTGMRTQIGLLNSAADIGIALILITIATLGKFGGAYVAGRISGLTGRVSAILGVLMNTRGLGELIVLNAGLDMGVLTPRLFTMLVLMAVITTVMTGPILKLLHVEDSAANAKILLFRERSLPSAGR